MDQLFGKRLILIILVLALIGGLFYFYSKTDNRVDNGETNIDIELASTTVVTITSAGFSETELNLKVGDIITFKNNDTENHWPASDAHPSHTIYPEFDPKKPIISGESWSFTFIKEGEWRFHDHENPLIRGVVKVFSPQTSTEKVLDKIATVLTGEKKAGEKCFQNSFDFSCYEIITKT